MKLKLICCEVLHRETCAVVARSPNQVDVEYIPQSLHHRGAPAMRQFLQDAIDRVDRSYEAILLGYGLCGEGILGLSAGIVPLVVPRACDCITLFLGDKERHRQYFQKNPEVYFTTTGWIERGTAGLVELNPQGFSLPREQMTARYGQENAQFLAEKACAYTTRYSQFTFIEMGVEPDGRFEASTRAAAAQRGLKFEKLRGDLGLIEGLVNGVWDHRYLIVEPGWRVIAGNNGDVIAAEKTR